MYESGCAGRLRVTFLHSKAAFYGGFSLMSSEKNLLVLKALLFIRLV